MASITIRNLDEKTKARLRVRAAQHGRSMEEEARTLLKAALRDEVATPGSSVVESIRARFRRLGGVELQLPAREPIRDPPEPGR
jgi:plasmid stability protein